MPRPTVFIPGALLVLLTPCVGQSVIIDNFESAPHSLALQAPGFVYEQTFPNSVDCIGTRRVVSIEWEPGGTGPMSAGLSILSGNDDAVVATFPDGGDGGELQLHWDNFDDPEDLTDGGAHNRVSIRATGGSPQTTLVLTLNQESHSATLGGAGTYQFPLEWYSDPSEVYLIKIEIFAGNGEVVEIRDVRTSSSTGAPLIYQVHNSSSFFACGATPSGITAVDWNWELGWPSQPTFVGPQLRLVSVGPSNCEGVTLNAFDAGNDGMGMVSVEWEASTVGYAAFEMLLLNDPGPTYDSQLAAGPVLTTYEDAFTVRHSVNVDGIPGVPGGVLHQELIVAPGPGQELTFDWIETGPWGSGFAAYSMAFGLTASLYDPAFPLLEIHTTGWYTDDAGATGVAPAQGAKGRTALAAHPSITRTETRFVVSGETVGPAVIDVLDVTGRRIRQLEVRGGEALWNGTSSDGSRVPAGVYFARTPGVAEAARVVFLR